MYYDDQPLFKDVILGAIDESIAREIDVLYIDCSDAYVLLPCKHLLSESINEYIDINIAENVNNEIMNIMLLEYASNILSNVNLVILRDKVINILSKYFTKFIVIDTDLFKNYVVLFYNTIDRYLSMYIKPYYDVRELNIVDNINELPSFYIMIDYDLNTEEMYFMLKINILFYRRI